MSMLSDVILFVVIWCYLIASCCFNIAHDIAIAPSSKVQTMHSRQSGRFLGVKSLRDRSTSYSVGPFDSPRHQAQVGKQAMGRIGSWWATLHCSYIAATWHVASFGNLETWLADDTRMNHRLSAWRHPVTMSLSHLQLLWVCWVLVRIRRQKGIQLCHKDIQPRRSVPGFNEASKEGEWEHVLFLHFPYQLWTDVKYVCTFKISCHNVIHRRVDLVFPMSPAEDWDRRLGCQGCGVAL